MFKAEINSLSEIDHVAENFSKLIRQIGSLLLREDGLGENDIYQSPL